MASDGVACGWTVEPPPAKALAKGSAGGADTSGIETLAVKFEADHPALAEGLRRVADTLAKAGI